MKTFIYPSKNGGLSNLFRGRTHCTVTDNENIVSDLEVNELSLVGVWAGKHLMAYIGLATGKEGAQCFSVTVEKSHGVVPISNVVLVKDAHEKYGVNGIEFSEPQSLNIFNDIRDGLYCY